MILNFWFYSLEIDNCNSNEKTLSKIVKEFDFMLEKYLVVIFTSLQSGSSFWLKVYSRLVENGNKEYHEAFKN
jgi:hypothetical protein